MAIGERIRFFRMLRGMTQKYLGMTVSGRVNRKYFMKKLCYSENETGG